MLAACLKIEAMPFQERNGLLLKHKDQAGRRLAKQRGHQVSGSNAPKAGAQPTIHKDKQHNDCQLCHYSSSPLLMSA